MELTSILNLDKINVSGMIAPKPERLKYYEEYYLAEGRFANAVIVDEHWNIRSGYMTYLLAKKYGVRPPIYEVRASRPLKKVVRGRYVRYPEWEQSFADGQTEGRRSKGKRSADRRQDVWLYTLKEPVVPGDILRVETRNGASNIRVEAVEYVGEDESCAGMRRTLKHVRKRKSVLESGT
ncbi:MAG: hypothetical protein NC123_10275 [Butyrivibrio sp.]|nr:hypothetical protein [Acetatifactor muris]MCM1559917.1 hypothetical protein [Butyrivibrio sp.]